MKGYLSRPWLLIGDFNKILLASDVKGGEFLANKASKFMKVLVDCKLIDLEP